MHERSPLINNEEVNQIVALCVTDVSFVTHFIVCVLERAAVTSQSDVSVYKDLFHH